MLHQFVQLGPNGMSQVWRACTDEVLGIKGFAQANDTVRGGQVCYPWFTSQGVNLSLDQISCHSFACPSFGHHGANAAFFATGLLVQSEM